MGDVTKFSIARSVSCMLEDNSFSEGHWNILKLLLHSRANSNDVASRRASRIVELLIDPRSTIDDYREFMVGWNLTIAAVSRCAQAGNGTAHISLDDVYWETLTRSYERHDFGTEFERILHVGIFAWS